jgi:hypothetical protein
MAPLNTPHGTIADISPSCARLTALFKDDEKSPFRDVVEMHYDQGNPLALRKLIVNRDQLDQDGQPLVKRGRDMMTIQVERLKELQLGKESFHVPERLTITWGSLTIAWRLDKLVINPVLDDELFIIDPSAAIAIQDVDSSKYIIDQR